MSSLYILVSTDWWGKEEGGIKRVHWTCLFLSHQMVYQVISTAIGGKQGTSSEQSVSQMINS